MILTIVVISTLLAAPRADAVPVFVNGSFETGDLTGWSGSETSDGYGLNPFGTFYGTGMDGVWWNWLAGYEVDRYIEQTVAGLTSGTTYRVSFIMASELVNSDQLNVSVDGGATALYTAPPISSTYWDNWVAKTYDFTATGTSATIRFSSFGLNDAGYDVGFDNVRIDTLHGVPEPATLTFVGLGLLGLLGVSRSKRQS